MDLNTPIEKIPYIGTAYQKKLGRLGIKNVKDLLLHLPFKYDDFSLVSKIALINPGEKITINGKVVKIENKRIFKKKMVLTQALIDDGSGTITATWFNQPYLMGSIEENESYFFSGKADYKGKKIQIVNPSVEKEHTFKKQIHTGRMVSVYPETRGVSSKWIRFIVSNLLLKYSGKIKETLPLEIIKENNFYSKEEAIKKIHFPDSIKEAREARRRLSFEQIFLIQLSVLEEKIRITKEKASSIPIDIDTIKRIVSELPFKLTDDQKKSTWQALKDMEKKYPMNRLIEGDVGSGKTVVAAIAMANTFRAGFQSAFMAPTEVLAKQHFKEVFKILKNINLNVGLLTGKEDKYYSKKLKSDFIEISRRKLLEKTAKGEIDLLIGTHALIQDKVKFNNLALVVLDEQHRFGVKQRSRLVSRRSDSEEIRIPHLLSMTATPIPRTLALTIYGDLDLSLIKELPKGRKKITTKIVSSKDRKNVYSLVKRELKKGKQAFVICPRIDVSEDQDKESRWSKVKAVKEEHENLSKNIFPEFNVGIIHGKMGVKEKERAMKDFRDKKNNILVSTSVVEVGIDVPDATVMIIEGAERFGLAQLHQLRGRVGRSKAQSYCFIFPEQFSDKTNKRMRAVVDSNDGFELSERDLQLRGPGDFIGARQWGIPDTIMDSLADIELVQLAKNAAIKILEKDFYLKKYPLLKKETRELRKNIHLE